MEKMPRFERAKNLDAGINNEEQRLAGNVSRFEQLQNEAQNMPAVQEHLYGERWQQIQDSYNDMKNKLNILGVGALGVGISGIAASPLADSPEKMNEVASAGIGAGAVMLALWACGHGYNKLKQMMETRTASEDIYG